MRPVDIILKKRNGGVLEREEIDFFVRGVTSGTFANYQASALLMAIVLRGMTPEETTHLTDAMIRSGSRVDLSDIPGCKVDKHSTGGVGDKSSLIIAPIAAACGAVVPMMSGRGLGHTGGTLDKLDSIPGFETSLTLAQARAQLAQIGCVLLGQTEEIAPADKKMYALRDATGTVESIPLIAASIMSKKLAEGLTGLVLDVKRGSGAFLPELERGLELATTMIELGADRDCPVVALLTAMDRPLGRACGNALEVEEAIQALTGEGPADLMEVTFALGVEMMMLGGFSGGRGEARATLEKLIRTGAAAEHFRKVIAAQGGDPRVVDDPGLLPQANAVEIYAAPRRGFIGAVEPRAIGKAIIDMGGGRTKMEDDVDPSVGLVITAKPGDWVEAGEPLGTIFARDRGGIETARQTLGSAIRISDEAEPPLPLISHRISHGGVEQLTLD